MNLQKYEALVLVGKLNENVAFLQDLRAHRHAVAQRRQGSAKKRRDPGINSFPTGNIDRPTMQPQQCRKHKSAGPQTQSRSAPSSA